VLHDVHLSAPNATIGVVLYPQIADRVGPHRITVTWGGHSEAVFWVGQAPVAFSGEPTFYLGEDQAAALDLFEKKLNELITVTFVRYARLV
jgi:hypothetical protein